MDTNPVTAETNVAEVLKTWPQTILVFLRYKTACVGCVMAPYETLADVSKNYEIPITQLVQELAESIQSGQGRPGG